MQYTKWLLALVVLMPLGIANAVVIPSGVSVLAEVSYDDVNSFIGETAQDDNMGVASLSTDILNGVINGDNPVSSQLTDPLFINSNLSATNQFVDFEFAAYFFNVALENNLTSEVEFFFTFDFNQNLQTSESGTGGDAYVDSSIELYDDTVTELISSYEYSDLIDGPALVSESLDFSFTLAAGESLTFDGLLEMNAYSVDEVSFSSLTNVSLELTKVVQHSTDVSEPALWSVFLLAGMLMFNRRKVQR